MDREEIYEELSAKVLAFQQAGGGTLVDPTGMFHGRDLTLYESLPKATGVRIVASTGLGPKEYMGGYFLTPQTNRLRRGRRRRSPTRPGSRPRRAWSCRTSSAEPAGLVAAIAAAEGVTATELPAAGPTPSICPSAARSRTRSIGMHSTRHG